jgi:hypothetical protein
MSSATDANRLAKAVIDRRRELAITGEEASDRAGISRSTWSHVESGAAQRISARTLAGVDEAMGWDPGMAASIYREREVDRVGILTGEHHHLHTEPCPACIALRKSRHPLDADIEQLRLAYVEARGDGINRPADFESFRLLLPDLERAIHRLLQHRMDLGPPAADPAPEPEHNQTLVNLELFQAVARLEHRITQLEPLNRTTEKTP